MQVTQFLNSPPNDLPGPIVALFGEDRWLKGAALNVLSRLVLGEGDDAGMTRFPGKEVGFKAVCDELLTLSMWGDRRLVVVEDADEFVTLFRGALEKYVKKPARKSVLVLDVKTWPKNTRLAKQVAEVGLDLDCKGLDGEPLARWLDDMCRARFGKHLKRDAYALLVDLAGKDLGLLEQELAKLASFVGDRTEIDVEDVRALVGGWRTETTFAMARELHAGNLGAALGHLDRLLAAGEAPQRILGGVNFVYRKLIRAVELTRTGTGLDAAIRQSGVFPNDAGNTARYLRSLGRRRAGEFGAQLIEADLSLKGGSRIPGRLVLERLLVQLSGRL